ncbi:electron transport complex subunit RsxD [Pantoea sp. Aalb]|uniref:electron transport complex subunit RsxD n=1 Tax=Pantoea sp. Aalb TaxID=2576762 RepID=UPI00132C862E|nr:electron transport complex subunit RsxD [Pantoea sp. Aalb]MXP67412.1 electron transport complex subunit RsxD [Pantoea sp. Aalb]
MFLPCTSSPYIHNCRRNTSNIMLLVVLATIPGIIIQSYFFGIGVLIQIFLAIFTALITEGMISCLRQKTFFSSLIDNSALLTAVLLAISIPSIAPWWLIVIGTIFAIIIAKQIYGGLGHNLFNPAMIGYVVLLISFPIQMTNWLPSNSELNIINMNAIDSLNMIFNTDTNTINKYSVDAISQATPLNYLKNKKIYSFSYKSELYGLAWYFINLAYLISGILLIIKKVIRWHIPLSILASLSICYSISWLFIPEKFNSPLVHLFSGATMLGAFFIATDPVTASITNYGRLIYGAFIGILVWIIRSFGGYPDGLAFAVLLANICVPLIDYYTQPRIYGYHKDRNE